MREVVDLRVLELRRLDGNGGAVGPSVPAPRPAPESDASQDAAADRLRRRDQVLHSLEVARRLRRQRRLLTRPA